MVIRDNDMEKSVILPPVPDKRWTLAKQLGIDTGIVRFWGIKNWWEYDTLLRTKNRFEDHGFSLDIVEDRPPMVKTVLGEEGRDEEIATIKQLLRNMGKIGIKVYCWVWTENPVGVIRTSDSISRRGDSRSTGYNHAQSEGADLHPAADITEDELWNNLQYFLDEVVPVAEEAGVKMALHPDDPPISPVRGVPRLVTSVENYERILDMYKSPNHGVTFCQGNFAAMGVDIPEAIHQLGEDIHFVHFRDVEGPTDDFVETWQDEGPTNMLAAMAAYRDIGFEGSIRPDHVPKMIGEDDRAEAMTGYTDMGRLFAVGYMEGLLEATK